MLVFIIIYVNVECILMIFLRKYLYIFALFGLTKDFQGQSTPLNNTPSAANRNRDRSGIDKNEMKASSISSAQLHNSGHLCQIESDIL